MSLRYAMVVSTLIFLPNLLLAQDRPDTLSESLGEDDALRFFMEAAYGKLTPDVMTVLKDSGAYHANLKAGAWNEYFYKPCFLCDPDLLQYDSLLKYSEQFDLTFIKETGTYSTGERSGFWTTYETSRLSAPFEWQKASLVTYMKGLKQDWEYGYLRDSIRQYVYRMSQMKDGLKHGFEYRFNENGDTLRFGQYQYGLEHGRFKFRHDTIPVLNFDRIYYLGEQVETIYFHPNGLVSMRGEEYEFGFHGIVKFYTELGELASEVTYDQGKVSGIARGYENGKLVTTQYFREGIADGLARHYHKNGQLWSEVEMKNGKMWTVISNYDRNGNKKKMGTLRNGDGTVIRYNEEGNRIAVDRFKNGKERK